MEILDEQVLIFFIDSSKKTRKINEEKQLKREDYYLR